MGYTDADWAGNTVDRKSTSRCCFSLESEVVSWLGKKQRLVALSFVEVEYMEASLAACETYYPPSCTRMDLQLSRQRLSKKLLKIESSEVQPINLTTLFAFPSHVGHCNKMKSNSH
jgi:hypothetical protein